MKRICYSVEQIICVFNTAEQLIAQCKTVVDVCRAIEATQLTYHRSKQQYGAIQVEYAKRLIQLDKDYAYLKKLRPRLNSRWRCSSRRPG